jgi:ornithine decarboxylase
VGSGQMSPSAFTDSIQNARQLFDYAREKFNHRMYFLDLGGGYPGSSDSGDLFNDIAKAINRALDEHFPVDLFAELSNGSIDNDDKKLRIIAEPGRYYACSAFTLCVSVIAKRVMVQSDMQQQQDRENLIHLTQNSNSVNTFANQIQPYHSNLVDNLDLLDSSKSMMYYINDGVYASFNCLFYDHSECFPILVNDHQHSMAAQSNGGKLYKSSIWGPTCDGLDVVVKECYLPEINTEEFMIFKNMGAYTLSGAVAFNGIPLAKPIYVASTSWDTIKNAFVDPIEDIMINNFASTASTVNTCAVAANLAFTRAFSNVMQQQQSDVTSVGGGSGGQSGNEDCDSVISDDRSANDGSIDSDIADVNQLTDQLNDDLTLNCLDQSSKVDCAIKC